MSILKELIKDETKQRTESITKLHSYLTNPGRFSVLLLGLRGTGKTHWLKEIQHLHKVDDKNLKSIVFVPALNANNKSDIDWDKVFEKSDKGLIVITDIEDLNKESQGLLFEGISTGDGGKFGFKEKRYDIRIVFTSSKNIATLRDNERFLIHKFFDRICQFAVKLPSFVDANKTIGSDFKKSWNKMCFKEKNECPSELIHWLEAFNQPLHGNFRDLDKLAINWHNYRLLGEKEEDILNFVKSDFNEFYRYPEHSENLNREFEISEDIDWVENMKKFKLSYKKYIKEKHGTLRKGEKEAGISYRTMERW